MTDTNDWILVEIDGEKVTLALTPPGKTASPHQIRTYSTADFATPSDCFNAYASSAGLALKGRQCCISIAAAVGSDTIRIPRSRWILSVSGLSYILGARPAILNDSVAKAWANLSFSPSSHQPLAQPTTPNFNAPGKWAAINLLEHGFGASLLVRDEAGRMFCADSEIGHAGFAPETDEEYRLLKVLSAGGKRVSWEQVMSLDPRDPMWTQAEISALDVSTVRASIFGAAVGDAALAFAAWSGVFVHGASKILDTPNAVAAFNRRFEEKGFYRANLRATPRWIVTIDNVNLRGAAHYLSNELNQPQ